MLSITKYSTLGTRPSLYKNGETKKAKNFSFGVKGLGCANSLKGKNIHKSDKKPKNILDVFKKIHPLNAPKQADSTFLPVPGDCLGLRPMIFSEIEPSSSSSKIGLI